MGLIKKNSKSLSTKYELSECKTKKSSFISIFVNLMEFKVIMDAFPSWSLIPQKTKILKNKTFWIVIVWKKEISIIVWLKYIFVKILFINETVLFVVAIIKFEAFNLKKKWNLRYFK